MKKIGILTWYFSANYGAKAQSYALQQTLTNMGYDCYMLNYKPQWSDLIEFWYEKNKPIMEIKRIMALKKANSIYKLTKVVYSAQDIDSLGLDCIVLGSDAIFNKNHPLFESIYYGVGLKTTKISFSPSCEDLNPETILDEVIRESLNEFSSISVRDVNTKQLIKNNIGKEPLVTLDPTLLYDFNEFNKPVFDGKYILFYAFSEWNEYGQIIRRYAKDRKLKIISVGQKCSWADISILNCSFEQWITAFAKAELVFTDSFHGVAFSIINKKQMVLCKRKDKIAKIESLLKDLGIELNIYEGQEIDSYLENNVDYDAAYQLLNAKREISTEYLLKSIEDV